MGRCSMPWDAGWSLPGCDSSRLFRGRRLFLRSIRISASSSPPPPSTDSIRVQFAPSPTGNLQLLVRLATTALFNYLFARQICAPNIEDTCLERSTKESEEALLGLVSIGMKAHALVAAMVPIVILKEMLFTRNMLINSSRMGMFIAVSVLTRSLKI